MSPTELSKMEKKDAVNLLYSNAGVGIFVTFIISSVLVFTFPHSGPDRVVQLGWWSIINCVVFIRLIDLAYFFSKVRHQSHDIVNKAFPRFASGVMITGALWACYTAIMMHSTNWAEVAITCIVISAFAGGSVSLLSGSKRLSVAYSAILTIPLGISLILVGGEIFDTLGYLTLGFFFIILASAHKAALFTSRSIHLKHQNDHLLSHMEQEVAKRTQEIYSLSNIDPLTGLFNRKAFSEKLNYRLQTQPNTQLAVLFIDLDGFKTINDSLGHETGDRVIREASQRIQQNIEPSDLLCRWGGDEFLLAIEQHQGLLEDAQELIATISLPYIVDGSKLNLGATIGIAYYPQHGTHHERLIQRADMAMYHQKRSEKGRVGIFDESLREQLMRELRLRDHLENAIHRHELFLVYQPIIATDTGKIEAVEALLRWRLDNEMIPPDEFIGIAEQYGFIRAIGLWVLGEACLAGKRLQDHHPDLGISVNVSIQQLLDDDFPDEVAATLKRTEFPAHCLDLEITESLFAHDKRRLIENIRRLKQTGIQVSIDDFGTGYSSLSVMQEFDVDYVKIDRSFIWSMDKGGRAIVEAVSQIATSFNYKVVAEGVETEEQRRLLSNMGVDYLQGYLFLPPTPEDELIRHLG
ncbi:putative bifunctional diguanylate cyclase/phosphodiesterase [Marinomonas ostreistagni]|uniref:EAL domain-containing protein n=1 Tax=Marinomonas ostreistagni TaxID=359209 RepID=A0ABS0ZBM4_9GAMM|nr:EAL domain-containing protein [Marinomonas ostreistagni]MBJ7551055.1 EAL domain-containing protein [Marinomonas ostreistagni]